MNQDISQEETRRIIIRDMVKKHISLKVQQREIRQIENS